MFEGPKAYTFKHPKVKAAAKGCLEWQGATAKGGYARVRHDGRSQTLIRLISGAKKGQSVLHTCDNPKCVNPDHLKPGTQKENVQDCIAKGRFKFPPGVRFAEKT